VTRPHFISDEDLHAFIDGALDAERAEQVRQALAENPALAERVTLFRADKAMFKTAYAPLADRPLPPEWEARIRRKSQAGWRKIYVIAAALLLVAVSPLAWRYIVRAPNSDVVETALEAREASGQGDIVIGDGRNAARYDVALRRAVVSNVHIPDLSRMGYRLRGLTVYGTAAEILYRGPQDQLFTLYVRRSDGTARFDQFERRGLRVCIWQDDQISTVMAGDISAAAMQRLATLSYTGLTS
jgi:anti-sigma factor RsiW